MQCLDKGGEEYYMKDRLGSELIEVALIMFALQMKLIRQGRLREGKYTALS